MEKTRFEDKQNVLFPLLLSFGAERTSDAQGKTIRKIKERESRIEKAYKFALYDKVDFEGARLFRNYRTIAGKYAKKKRLVFCSTTNSLS